MRRFNDQQIITLLLEHAQWTLLLSLIAFVGGAALGLVVTVMRVAPSRPWNLAGKAYTGLIQSTPLLMMLFLIFFGLPLIGINVNAWIAAIVSLVLFTSAFLADIWRGAIEAVGKGQWEAARSTGLSFLQAFRLVIVPQALRMALPPTVGFSVQVVKGTALTSIIGFVELTKAGTMLNNVTFRPFFVFAAVAAIYFTMCFPLSLWARHLERRLHAASTA